jgi:hypothetical protein
MKYPWVSPMTVRDVRQRLGEFTPANRDAFLAYASQFSTQGNVELTLPAYGLGSNGYLLLDGNHRATAIAMCDIPFEMSLAILDGPVDRRILRDLKFWDGGVRRFARRFRRVSIDEPT